MQLFIRTTRQVKLTPPARILLREFEKIYDSTISDPGSSDGRLLMGFLYE